MSKTDDSNTEVRYLEANIMPFFEKEDEGNCENIHLRVAGFWTFTRDGTCGGSIYTYN